MKAAQLYTANDVRVVDVSEPEPKEGEALVEVEWCGICGSDLKEYTSGPLAVVYGMVPKEDWQPMTLGHEVVGIIKKAPSDSTLQEGDPVVINPATFCRSCERCQQFGTVACRKVGSMGLSGGYGGQHGGLAQFVAVDAQKCYPLPRTLPLDQAALIEPMCVAWHAAKTPELESYAGKSVLVIGSGPVGLYLSFALRNKGASQIIVSEPTAVRRRQAELVADLALDPLNQNVVEEVLKATNNRGVDVSFDVAGSKPGLEAALGCLAYRGTHVNIALWSNMEIPIPWRGLMHTNCSFRGSSGYNEEDFLEVIQELSSGRFPSIENTITAKFQLDEIEKGFQTLVNDMDSHIKILISPKPYPL